MESVELAKTAKNTHVRKHILRRVLWLHISNRAFIAASLLREIRDFAQGAIAAARSDTAARPACGIYRKDRRFAPDADDHFLLRAQPVAGKHSQEKGAIHAEPV